MRGQKAREVTDEERDQYLATPLKFDEAGHHQLMKEAAQMDRILAGEHVRPPPSLFLVLTLLTSCLRACQHWRWGAPACHDGILTTQPIWVLPQLHGSAAASETPGSALIRSDADPYTLMMQKKSSCCLGMLPRSPGADHLCALACSLQPLPPEDEEEDDDGKSVASAADAPAGGGKPRVEMGNRQGARAPAGDDAV